MVFVVFTKIKKIKQSFYNKNMHLIIIKASDETSTTMKAKQ